MISATNRNSMIEPREGVPIPIEESVWGDVARGSIKTVVRGLEELITNSATSYFKQGKPAAIRILVEENTNSYGVISVWDQAQGLSRDELQARILDRIGRPESETTKGDEGRGHFRRGLRDLLVRGTLEVASVKNGKISSAELWREGNTAMRSPEVRVEPASAENLTRYGFKTYLKSGTLIRWRFDKADDFGMPIFRNLKSQLEGTPALWRLIADWDRAGHVIKLEGVKKEDQARLVLALPPQGKKVFDDTLNTQIEGAQATHLRVYWSHERLPPKYKGIVVCGVDAVYGHPFISEKLLQNRDCDYLFGILDCNSLDLILRNDPEAALVDPQRISGLSKEHPFVRELIREVEVIVADLLEQHRTESEASVVPEEVRRSLNRIGRLFTEKLQEIEGGDDPDTKGDRPEVFVAPYGRGLWLEPEESGRFYCYVRSQEPPGIEIVEDGIPLDIELCEPTAWPKDERYWRVPILVRARDVIGTFIFLVGKRGDLWTATLGVRVGPREEIPTNEFHFQYETTSVRRNSQRRLRLYAPFGDGEWEGVQPRVISRDSEALVVRSISPFKLNRGAGDLLSSVVLEGRIEKRAIHVQASVDSAVAHCRVDVVEGEAGGETLFGFDFTKDPHKGARATWTKRKTKQVLIIYEEHPALKMFLPDSTEDAKRDKRFLAVVAEILIHFGGWLLVEARCRQEERPVYKPIELRAMYEQETEGLAADVHRWLRAEP